MWKQPFPQQEYNLFQYINIMATLANQETIRYVVVPPVTLPSFNKFSGEAYEDLQSFLSQFQQYH